MLPCRYFNKHRSVFSEMKKIARVYAFWVCDRRVRLCSVAPALCTKIVRASRTKKSFMNLFFSPLQNQITPQEEGHKFLIHVTQLFLATFVSSALSRWYCRECCWIFSPHVQLLPIATKARKIYFYVSIKCTAFANSAPLGARTFTICTSR